jgi:hypothetical protein
VCADGVDASVPATWANVEQILAGSCGRAGCHDGQPNGTPVLEDLRAGHAWASVVGVVATEQCTDGGMQLRVVPGDAGASYLYHKLTDDPPCQGSQMPKSDVPEPLPACEIDLIKRWIESGAPN